MPSPSLLHACRVSRSLRPQSASCSILALRSPYACFYLILAILNYFNLSSVFILNYHAFYSLLYFNFFCLILTDAAPTCLECPRGRVAVYRERKRKKGSRPILWASFSMDSCYKDVDCLCGHVKVWVNSSDHWLFS